MPRQFQEPCLLFGLERGESHGYELAEYLRGLNMPIDLATVYRKLQSMERRGLIVSRWEESPSGPKRRVYRLTDAGLATARDAVKELEEVAAMVSCALNSPTPVK
ncbi:MAG: PadR family transcriptional regulator [Ilumatobacteraceae bacterium]